MLPTRVNPANTGVDENTNAHHIRGGGVVKRRAFRDVTNQGHEGGKVNLIGKKNVPEQSKVESRDPRNSERAMNSNAILQPTEQSISISSSLSWAPKSMIMFTLQVS